MLDLDDLTRVLAVSREWSAAVRSMAPIHAKIDLGECESTPEMEGFCSVASIRRIVASPLLRHIAAIQTFHPGRKEGTFWTPLNTESLALLAQHAPNLSSLSCALTLAPHAPLILPAKLRSLGLQLDGSFADSEVNDVLTTLAALPSLSVLCLYLSGFNHENKVELSLLAASRSLTDFTLTTMKGNPPVLSAAQISQIGLSLGHMQRFFAGWMDSDSLARLLQPPVTAQWQDIGHLRADERTGDLLLRLPTLSKLHLYYISDAADVDFLSQLPFLTDLGLHCRPMGNDEAGQNPWSVPADAVLASLQLCHGLTELYLQCGFNSAHWSALLSKLTNLKRLTIRGGQLETLQCFATGPITQSLQQLTIRDLQLPPSEVSHLYALHRLRTLYLIYCFGSPLNAATLARISAPTRLLPALTELRHGWRSAGKNNDVHRRGRSFE